ncbi:MAG: ribonuclease H-like domain-containing protein, partial [Gammaproteobacteria bacterium]
MKTLAKYLGFNWRDPHPSIKGYDRWIKHKDPRLKQRFLAYNEDDCRATRVLLDAIVFPVHADFVAEVHKKEGLRFAAAKKPKKPHTMGSDSGSSPASVSTYEEIADAQGWSAVSSKLDD